MNDRISTHRGMASTAGGGVSTMSGPPAGGNNVASAAAASASDDTLIFVALREKATEATPATGGGERSLESLSSRSTNSTGTTPTPPTVPVAATRAPPLPGRATDGKPSAAVCPDRPNDASLAVGAGPNDGDDDGDVQADGTTPDCLGRVANEATGDFAVAASAASAAVAPKAGGEPGGRPLVRRRNASAINISNLVHRYSLASRSVTVLTIDTAEQTASMSIRSMTETNRLKELIISSVLRSGPDEIICCGGRCAFGIDDVPRTWRSVVAKLPEADLSGGGLGSGGGSGGGGGGCSGSDISLNSPSTIYANARAAASAAIEASKAQSGDSHLSQQRTATSETSSPSRSTRTTPSRRKRKTSAVMPEVRSSKRRRLRATTAERAYLMAIFEASRWPSMEAHRIAAEKLGWSLDSVKVWFQNRRRTTKKAWLKAHPNEPLPDSLIAPRGPRGLGL